MLWTTVIGTLVICNLCLCYVFTGVAQYTLKIQISQLLLEEDVDGALNTFLTMVCILYPTFSHNMQY